jgi:anti-sigma regulatory factor (Ser/Thr protein kinase)
MATFTRSYQSGAQWLGMARRDVAQFATHCEFSADQVLDILLAVGEALSNTVEHAKSTREFSVRCEFEGERLTVRIQDQGKGFALPTSISNSQPLKERGFGIDLMKHLMDRVEFLFEPDAGTTVVLQKTKYAERPASGRLATCQPK